MNKKPSNLAGVVIILELVTIIAFIIWSILFPDSKYVVNWGGNRINAVVKTAFMGFALLIISALIFNAIDNGRNYARSSIVKTNATVVSRASEFRRSSGRTGGRPLGGTHFLSFEFPDGTRKNFKVDVTQFNTIIENETGILTYRECGDWLRFVDFQRQV